MYLIVGLGNPGDKYKKTFHNVGFLAVEDLAIMVKATFDKLKCKALIAETRIGTEKVIIAKPQTFMNLSGDSVREIIDFYKIPTENVLVIYDDVDIEKGSLRLREKGSAGTHNGMRDIVNKIGEDFKRIRIGTHDKESQMQLYDYVLSNIKKEDYPLFTEVIQNSAKASLDWVSGDSFEAVMRKYNKTVK